MPPSLAGVVSQRNTGEEEQGFKLFRICRAKEQSIFEGKNVGFFLVRVAARR